MATQGVDIVQELEHYLSRQTLDSLVKELMVLCLREKPEEPLPFLLRELLHRTAAKGGTEAVAVASSSTASDGEAAQGLSMVAVAHPVPATQQVSG
jgi:hypothetical protein